MWVSVFEENQFAIAKKYDIGRINYFKDWKVAKDTKELISKQWKKIKVNKNNEWIEFRIIYL